MRKALGIILTILFFCIAIVYGWLLWLNSELQKFAPQDVIMVCEQLDFPSDSDFCNHPRNQTGMTLQEMFLEQFPLSKTNYSDLMVFINTPVITNSCEEQEPRNNSVCPPPETCGGEYSCKFRLPGSMDFMRIHFDKDGYITEVYVQPRDS
jgi:hypothetical protein